MSARRPPPQRRFGQNFLESPPLAAWIVDAFDPGPTDRVVEIGPGQGALTRGLAERAGTFVALEIDERLIDALEASLADLPHARIVLQDALTVDWSALARDLGGSLRVIGNLPYNVGTAIVGRLLASDAISDLQVVLQREVADRIAGEPRTKSYGPISVVAALRAERKRLRSIAPGAFRPRPKVTSAVLRLTMRAQPPLEAQDVPWLERWLHRGFAQRRKTLASNLPALKTPVREWLVQHGHPEDLRAEALPPQDWLELARSLDALDASDAAPRDSKDRPS